MAVKTIQYQHHTFNISYEIVNPDAKYPLVFLHGWGSNKALMKQAFGTHLDMFRHVYVDLPGFGNSTCNMALTTDDYANIMELFLAQINANQDPIIVGHSFGGKVALLLNPRILVLIGSAGIKRAKSLKVQAKIALFKLLKMFGLTSLRKFFVAEDAKELSEPMYETFKNVAFVAVEVNMHFLFALCLIPTAWIGHHFGMRAHDAIINNQALFKKVIGTMLILVSSLGLLKVYL